jgi:hypothetical protein
MDPNRSAISEAATRQILLRIASVFNDPDLCDAAFIVGEGEEKEEIRAPSQFMAISSTAFKAMFYPPTGNRDTPKIIPEMQPYIFRKILDYLFRGMVPLNSIEDGWKCKVAARQFMLKDLEDLCTKFLKYRMDSQNIIEYMKNSTTYNAPDLREAVIQRFTKEANAVLANDEILELDQEELLDLLKTRPSMQARKLMDVLIRWAKKRYQLETKTTTTNGGAAAKDDAAKAAAAANAAANGTAATAEKDAAAEAKTNGDASKEKEDGKSEEGKGDAAATPMDASKDGSDAGEKRKRDESEERKEDKPVDMVQYIAPFATLLPWEKSDTEYFLKEVRGRLILSAEDENAAMVLLLNSFLDATSKKAAPAAAQLQQVQLSANRTSRTAAKKSRTSTGPGSQTILPAGGKDPL